MVFTLFETDKHGTLYLTIRNIFLCNNISSVDKVLPLNICVYVLIVGLQLANTFVINESVYEQLYSTPLFFFI